MVEILIFSWNEFTFPLILGGRTTKPVPIAMLDLLLIAKYYGVQWLLLSC